MPTNLRAIRRAMDVLMRATQAAMPHLPEKALSRAAQRARPHKDLSYTWDETYTLPENLFIAYQRSGDSRFKDFAMRFIEDDYFLPLADGQNVLPGEHAYSHVNAFSSAMQSYMVLGEEKYFRAAKNGFRMVQDQSFATGGWGPDEAFVVPGSGGIGSSLDTTHNSFETPCGAYGHFKAARYLLRATKDSRYGDSMERVLYNTIGGATATLARWHDVLLLRLQQNRQESSLRTEVALLLGHVPATGRRLPHQLVSTRARTAFT